jgi:hypothetical protein
VTSNYVLLTENQRLKLSRIAQSRSLPAGYVFRARLILLLAEGASYHSIKLRLGTAAPPMVPAARNRNSCIRTQAAAVSRTRN